MESIRDPRNVVGLSSLIDLNDIGSDIDLKKIEQEIIQGSEIEDNSITNHADEYKKEMEKIMKNMHSMSNNQNENYFDYSNNDTKSIISEDNDYAESVISEMSYSNNLDTMGFSNDNMGMPGGNNMGFSNDNMGMPGGNNMGFSNDNMGMSGGNNMGFSNDNMGMSGGNNMGFSNDNMGFSNDNMGMSGGNNMGMPGGNNMGFSNTSDNQLRNMTMEERRQNHISQVLGDIDDKELECIDQERDEDSKTSLLEQIDMLRITLDDDGIDVSGVPVVSKTNSLNDIQNVYKILRLKNDRNRYCSFAEELILAGAYGLENLFDGEKIWFGNYRPDLVGWSSTVKVKLRRMRYETSTFVGEIMENYQMSAGVRLMLELVPSLFLYSRQKKISVNDNLVTQREYNEAVSNLNTVDDI